MPDKDDNHVVSQGTSAEGSTHMPPLDSVRNDTVGDFRLLRKLGEGGMGLVYEAEQHHPHRLVALKIIRGGRYVDQLQIKMFEREAAALARLKHPGIATIYEMGHLPDGQPFFAMELVRGVALSEYVGARPAKDSALPRALRARLALFVRICDAVNYAHQRGVIHRDLKPSNILVTTASDRRSSGPLAEQVPDIKILDFGLARIADPDAKVTRTLLDSGLHGTLAYMSPEQTRGNPDEIDVRTDVYSLGVILYELVTGRLPYDVTRVSPLEALRIIADVVPPPPSRITGRAVDRDIDTIALRALEKEPRSRYQTALALAEDIERYLADQPILARSPTAGYQIKKLIKRHKMAFALVAAGAALLVVFTVAMAFARERAVQAERRAEAEAETARQVSRFLVDLFKFSDPTEALGQRVTARELLDRGAQRIEVELGGQPAVRAALMETMGQAYAGLGLYDAGERLLRRAVDNRSRVAGPRHAEVAAAQSVLADVLVARGQYEEAESLLRNALAVQRAAIGNQAPITDTLSSLASLLHETGRYADAEVVYREALALRRSLLGNRHPDVAQSLNNLGTLYRSKAEYTAAEPLLEEALEMNRDAYGNDHPEVATSLNNLGMVLAAQGRYREADERLRESLAIRRKVLGDDHEETAISLNNVGYLLTLKGDRAASEPFYREALEIRQRVLGRDHPLVANTVNNLASALADRKDYEGADRLYREALSIRRSLFGDEHPLVAQSYNNLGTLLMRKASFDEAAPLFERAVGISRRVLGADHPETANYLFNQGRLARARKDPAAALRLFDDVLALRRKRLAADHPDIAAALFQKAQALIDLRRYADAERDALEALRINVTKMGDLHAATTATRQLLVTLYEKWQRPTEAAKYRATP